jgi:hypothetical protein
LKESNTAPCRPEENSEKTGFVHFFALNKPKTSFFAQKYLARYIPETFFEEYNNFAIFFS